LSYSHEVEDTKERRKQYFITIFIFFYKISPESNSV